MQHMFKLHIESVMVLLALLGAMMSSCTTGPDSFESGKDETPGEYLYQMRAFPFDTINRLAVIEGKQRWLEASRMYRNNNEQWENVGPYNIGGRITALALHPESKDIMYAGASVGGIWKSEDRGYTWEVIFEEPGALSIGALAIAKSSPEVIYAGTGESNATATSGAFFGNGIYKSEDGGATWSHIGLDASGHIGRIAVDPNDPDRVFVAVAGDLYGKSQERGVYRSLNGGETWKRTLFVSDSTACIDLVMDPTDDQVLYAAMWERLRYPYSRSYAGITSGVHRSIDGGNTWQRLSGGLPFNADVGRIGLAVSSAENPSIYAVYTSGPSTNRFAGLFRSDDRGDTWIRADDGTLGSIFSNFGWFFSKIRVSPARPDDVYILGLQNWKSVNNGLNWDRYTSNDDMHVDQHALEFHPLDDSLVVAGNDGGLYVSNDAGATWRHASTLPISQFYATKIDPQHPRRIYGGMQDNGTAVTRLGGVDQWEQILGGDGFRTMVDPYDSNMIYCEAQFGYLVRSFDGGKTFLDGTFGIDFNDRNNWNTPVFMNPLRPSTLYYGTQRLYISRDRADSWVAISGDLTDPQTSAFDFGTISTISVATSDTNVIYVGTDDGVVQRSRDLGESWEVISDDLPLRYVTQVAIDENDSRHIYATLSGYRSVDYLPHVFESNNGGDTWIDISGNLPEVPVNDIVIDPDIAGRLYVATDQSVWFTNDNGVNWELLGAGLPSTVVNDLDFHRESRILVAATFGRSQFKYQLDEVSSVSEIKPTVDFTRAYPNPTSGHLTVELPFERGPGNSSIIVDFIDIQGRIQHQSVIDRGAQTVDLDLSHLGSGLYTLRFETSDSLYISRVVVAH